MKTVVLAIAVVVTTTLVRGADNPVRTQAPVAIIITNKAHGAATGKTPYLSAGLPEIVKMHKAGVDASVLLAFIQNSPTAYHPSAKEIIYLRDLGLSNDVISALLRRGGELRERAAEAQREERARTPAPPATPAPAPVSPAPPQASTPAPVVVYANPTTYPVYTSPVYVPYPAYSYASPRYYNYGYCAPYYRRAYYPSVYAGYRWGCSPSYGLTVGYRGGSYSVWGGGYRGGYGYARGSYYCRR